MLQDLLRKLETDLAELVSRGVNHPSGDQIVGGMRVALQQAIDEAGAPPPEPEPVQARLEAGGAMLQEVLERLDRLQASLDAISK